MQRKHSRNGFVDRTPHHVHRNIHTPFVEMKPTNLMSNKEVIRTCQLVFNIVTNLL